MVPNRPPPVTKTSLLRSCGVTGFLEGRRNRAYSLSTLDTDARTLDLEPVQLGRAHKIQSVETRQPHTAGDGSVNTHCGDQLTINCVDLYFVVCGGGEPAAIRRHYQLPDAAWVAGVDVAVVPAGGRVPDPHHRIVAAAQAAVAGGGQPAAVRCGHQLSDAAWVAGVDVAVVPAGGRVPDPHHRIAAGEVGAGGGQPAAIRCGHQLP